MDDHCSRVGASRAELRLRQVSKHFITRAVDAMSKPVGCSSKPAEKIRLVVIGAVAAGASFAARARRLCEAAEITLLERGSFVSFANCGLPYYIGGTIQNESALIVNTPQSLSDNLNLTVHTNTEAVRIDREKKEVIARNSEGKLLSFPYDRLLLAPGASPLRPPYSGCFEGSPRVCTLRSIEDMKNIVHLLETSKRVVIVGGGFIGLEVLEQIHRIKHVQELSLLELREHVLPVLDPELMYDIEDDLRANGVRLYLNERLKCLHHRQDLLEARRVWKGDHHMELELDNSLGTLIPADLVILSIGIKPDSQLAIDAQLQTSKSGHILVNDFMQTSDECIYAAGDAVLTKDLIYPDRSTACALGGPANRQGRLAADHAIATLSNERFPLPYPGSLGTAIVRVFSTVAGITGWSEHRLDAAGKVYDSVLVHGNSHAAYFGGAKDMILKVVYDPTDGRLLGGQVVGPDGAGVDKRIDVLAMACANKMTIEQLQHVELSYAPPFNSAKDPVNLAGFAAVNQWKGHVKTVHGFDDVPTKEMHIIDVRDGVVAALSPLKPVGHMHVQQHPYTSLRQWLHTKEAEELKKCCDSIVVVCSRGKTSYFASRILQQNGFPEVLSLSGGLASEPSVVARAVASSIPTINRVAQAQLSAQQAKDSLGNGKSTAGQQQVQDNAFPTVTLDCTGQSCPGPLLALRDAVDKLSPGQCLRIIASDKGFYRDVNAFSRMNNLLVLECAMKDGLVDATIKKPKLHETHSAAHWWPAP